MLELPRQLGDRADARVHAWWRALAPASRAELVRLWRRPRRAAIELHAVLVDSELAVENALWSECLNEYIDNHEDVRFFMEERSYHICRAHPLAREVARSGVVPRSFACPRASKACPFARASTRAAGILHLVAC